MTSIRQLFDQACDLPVTERIAFLQASGAEPAVIAEVLALLNADEDKTEPYPYRPDAWLEALAATEPGPGATIGAWRLTRELGRGGMGSVFLAERADGHFRQQAAVKLIRGLPDAVAAARFARERQTLANLQHPQIARLLDGGATASGQPFLVMEHVDGIAIDRWCQQNNADLATRLALFVSVCRTVQFAHQQLVVHCDIKPSNILVRADGVPVLLDFGIARTVRAGDSLANDTTTAQDAFTEAASGDADLTTVASLTLRPMTPRYASPEQLKGGKPDIASDVYALGLVLYELVSGQQPERSEGTLKTVPSLAAQAMPWRHRLRGDLDAIVARACVPEPDRRYATAQALADDVARIGQHRPVQARSQNRLYVFSRLLRRRWVVFATVLLVAGLTAAFTWRTVQSERRALIEASTAQRATDFLVSVFAASDSNVHQGALVELSAREVLDRGRDRIATELADQPQVRARLLEALGHAYRHMNLGAIAVPLLREAAALNLSPTVDDRLAAARCLEAATNAMANGEFPAAEAEQVARQALALAEETTGSHSQQTANAWMVLSLALNRNGKYREAEMAGLTTLAMNQTLPPPENRISAAHHNLGLILAEAGMLDPAREYNRLALAETPPGVSVRAMRLRVRALIERRAGEWDASITTLQEALAIAAHVHGDHGGFAIRYRREMVATLFDSGRFEPARALLERARTDQVASGGETGDEYLAIQQDFASGQVASGEVDAALAALTPIIALRRERYGDDDPRTLAAQLDGVEATLFAGTETTSTSAEVLQHVLASWQARGENTVPQALRAHLLRARWQLQTRAADLGEAELAIVEQHRDRLPAVWQPLPSLLRAWRLRQLGDDDAALALSEQALADHRRWLGDQHPRTAMAALILARSLRAAGQSRQADELELTWRPSFERGFPETSVFRRALPEA